VDAESAATSRSFTAAAETATESSEESTLGLIFNNCNKEIFYHSHRHYGLMVLLVMGLTLAVACSYSTFSTHPWQRHPQSQLRGLAHSNSGDAAARGASTAREDKGALKEASGFLGLVERSNGSAVNASNHKVEERSDDAPHAPSDEAPLAPTFPPLGSMADSLAKSNMPGAGGSKDVSALEPPTSTQMMQQQPLPGHGKAAAVASSDIPGVSSPANVSLAADTKARAPVGARSQRGMPDSAAELNDQRTFFL